MMFFAQWAAKRHLMIIIRKCQVYAIAVKEIQPTLTSVNAEEMLVVTKSSLSTHGSHAVVRPSLLQYRKNAIPYSCLLRKY